MSAPAWSDYIISEYEDTAQLETDEEIDEYVRSGSFTNGHACCTVRMGGGNGTGLGLGTGDGALGSDLRVKGAVGLRVVDSSIFVSAFADELSECEAHE